MTEPSAVEFLRHHVPFDGMTPADLAYLAGQMKVGHYAPGATTKQCSCERAGRKLQ